MQKVVDFLEKYCQWLAVGLAALFFLFALWQFLPGISTPVTAEIAGAPRGPAEVDPAIAELADQLQAKIGAPDRIKDTVPPYGKQFIEHLATAPKVKPLPPEALAVRGITIPDPLVPLPPDKIGTDDSNINNQGPIALPKPPAATLDPSPTTGFAQVTDPAAAPAAPVQPVINVPPGGQPAAPNPNANAKDVTWVRVPYIISTRQIQQAFQTVGIPPVHMRTGLTRVELIRQRELPGNQWEAEEVVKTLTIGQPLRTLPPAGSPVNVMLDFANWAYQNQQLIAQPPFYTIVGGENPNVTKPVEVVQADVFDPATFPRNGDLSKLTPEQRKQVLDHRKANPVVRQPPPQRGPTGGEGGGGRIPRGARGRGGGMPEGMEPRMAPPAVVKPGEIVELQARPGGVPNYPGMRPGAPAGPGMPPGGYPAVPPGGYPGMGEEGMAPEMPGVPTPGQPITLPPVPAGPWNVDQAGTGLGDIYGVAYDTDARGDSSYRYRIRYYITNPLYNTKGVTQNPALAQEFELVGEDKDKWSDPIEIAPRSYVFLAAPPQANATNVRFTIYHWQNGRQHKTVASVGVGDSIGKVENDIDFRTPWTFVEARRDPSSNNVYALLMNSEGKLRRNIFQVDKDSPQQKKLSEQVDAANTAAGQAAAAPGGAAAGGTRPPGGVTE